LDLDELIAVVGMHRSGTSMAAHLAHELGVTALGARTSLVRADRFNSRGYWESADLVMANTYLCNFLGCDWRHPVVPPEGWHLSRRLDPLRERLRRLLAETPAGRRSIKDPRMAMTLPFWQTLAPNNATLLCLRSPASVAHSLDRREHMAKRWALGLWTMHTALAVHYARAARCLFLVYEDLLADPGPQAERVAAFVGVDTARARTAAAAVVSPDLSHSEAVLDDGARLEEAGAEGQAAARLWRAALVARAAAWDDEAVAALVRVAEDELASPALAPPAPAYRRRHRLRFLVKTMRLAVTATGRPGQPVVLPSGRTLGPLRRIERPQEY
jgi:hypothetical protein